MTTGFDLDEIERLLAAATPGEWRTCALDQGAQIWCGSNYIGETRDYTGDDAALIVTLHNSAPAMPTEIRELRELRKRFSEAVCEWRDADTPVKAAKAAERLHDFILPAPDPLVGVIKDLSWDETTAAEEWASDLRAAMQARGGKIVWGEG